MQKTALSPDQELVIFVTIVYPDTMNRFLLLTGLFLCTLTASGQMYFKEGRQICCGDSLLAGNVQALDINPSQLGRVSKKKFSLGLLQLGSNVYSNRLDLSDALGFALSDDSVSADLKNKLLTADAGDPFTFTSNLDLNWAAFSFATPKFGGIAIRVKDRAHSYSLLPNDLLSLMLEGKNSEAYQTSTPEEMAAAAVGTRVQYSHVRELSVGYGRSLFKSNAVSLYLGVAAKRLWGIGNFNMNITAGGIKGHSAFSQFYNINYGALEAEYQERDAFERKLLDNSGSGWGFDGGFTLEIARRLVLGAAVLDLGSLEWNKGVISAEAPTEDFFEGVNGPTINTLNFKEELGKIYENFQFEDGTSFSAPLNTQLRLNAAWLAGRRLSVNADVLLPLNNGNPEVLNYQTGTYAAGFNYVVLSGRILMNVSSALFYSSEYSYRVPLGISIGSRQGAMFSIAATDLLTFINNKQNPYPGISITGLNWFF